MNRKMIIYQIFVRLFGNKNTQLTHNGNINENGCGKFDDINHLALQSIKELGVTHIWYIGILEHATMTNYSEFGICPDFPEIVKGKAGSPYAVKDYYDVDPDLANNIYNRMDEFEALVQRTHHHGMKVIIDFVPNHVARNYISDKNPGNFVDFGIDDDYSIPFDAQNNFYYIPNSKFECPATSPIKSYHEDPAKATGNDHFSPAPSMNDWYETVKLNYGVDYLNNKQKHFTPTPNTWLKMRDILSYWTQKKVDGFRCDMAHMVPVEFWNWVIPDIKNINPNIVFLAEIYSPELYQKYLTSGNFDYLYDKVGLYDTLRAITEGTQTARSIPHCWKSVEGFQHKMLYFLENHDEQRIASQYFAGNPSRAIPAMTLTASFNINPLMLYFGQEVGEPANESEGYSGNDGRTTIFDYWSVPHHVKWMNRGKFDGGNLSPLQSDLRLFYKKLLNLCKNTEAFSMGSFYDIMWKNYENHKINPDKIYAYLRYYKHQIFLIVLNFSEYQESFSLLIPQHAWDTINITDNHTFKCSDKLLSERSFTVNTNQTVEDGITLTMTPWEACIFEMEKTE